MAGLYYDRLRKATCALCGKPIRQGAKIIEEIDGLAYYFDRGECVTLFKKFKSVYGSAFLV
jgi:YHS domain-containing protein